MDDILRIWEDKGDDWSLGEINGRSGYFPGNYVQRIRVTKRLTLKKMASNKILELQAKCVISTDRYIGAAKRVHNASLYLPFIQRCDTPSIARCSLTSVTGPACWTRRSRRRQRRTRRWCNLYVTPELRQAPHGLAEHEADERRLLRCGWPRRALGGVRRRLCRLAGLCV